MTDTAGKTATPDGNLLGGEISPYLLQHADNPVHWRPWGEAALAEARKANKPILLSVGYAACHWCHVMAHESFENEAIAGLMNAQFVNIKVDREERPDLDQIYQHALALLGEQGGWPLTMFLTPQGEPFWGGTYFPPEARYGRPGFPQVLTTIARIWQEEPEKVSKNVTALREALGRLGTSRPGGEIPLPLLDQIAEKLATVVDVVHGGTNGAPKFPAPYLFELLWRAWLRGGRRNARLRDAVEVTLDRMCQGGIYDHLGGGFARYSTDAEWLVPHFEKMLYDNALLIDLLTLVWQESRSPLYRERVEETIGWVAREMVAEGGGFAASLDADSEGEEGKFYVWTHGEVEAALGADFPVFARHYDVTPEGNWEHKTILHRNRRPALADRDTEALLASCRAKLLAIRGARVRPGWDDKVLADWNGLMIAALANAATVFGRPDWLDLARTAFAFVQVDMEREGRLFHAWRGGKLQHRGTLDDHANMIRAALALAEAESGREDAGRYVAAAQRWTEALDRHFWDADDGGYFYTADDAGDLIVRVKHAHDNAVPAGNGTMLANLIRLELLTGDGAYGRRAEALLAAFAGELQHNFFPLATLLNGAELLRSARQVVIAGEAGAGDTQALRAAAYAVSAPNRVLQLVPPGAALPAGHPAAGKGKVDGKAAAYVCHGQTCSAPVTDPEALRALLGA